MIVRIMGEGQWELPDTHLAELDRLDDDVEAAVEREDEAGFATALTALLDSVRAAGQKLPDDLLHDSDLILPPADSSIEDVRHMLEDEGLIPG